LAPTKRPPLPAPAEHLLRPTSCSGYSATNRAGKQRAGSVQRPSSPPPATRHQYWPRAASRNRQNALSARILIRPSERPKWALEWRKKTSQRQCEIQTTWQRAGTCRRRESAAPPCRNAETAAVPHNGTKREEILEIMASSDPPTLRRRRRRGWSAPAPSFSREKC
jgi:hypothetical protein